MRSHAHGSVQAPPGRDGTLVRVTRKTQIRKPIPVKPQRTPVPSLTPAQQAVVDAARQLPQLTDPLEVEIALSASVAPSQDDPWAGVIANAAAVPSRRSLALLRAVAAMVPGSSAAAEADKLADVPEPAWASAITQLQLDECWLVDQTADAAYQTLLCTYRYGDQVHAGVYLIDEQLNGSVKNAFVTRDVESAKTMLADHGEVESITAVEAHRQLGEAYAKLDGGPGLGIDPDAYLVRLLALRRVELAQRA
jgi:hypothetical protein